MSADPNNPDLIHVSVKLTKFDSEEDRHEITIPDGYAACIVKIGDLLARIDLEPGTHVITGCSFDDYDVPFGIAILKMEHAQALSSSKAPIPDEAKYTN